jgi:hypothetical protein
VQGSGPASYAIRPIASDIAAGREFVSPDTTALTKKGLVDDQTNGQRIKTFEFCSTNHPIAPGSYRLEIEVLKDNSVMSNVTTELLVSHYQPGK